MAQHHDSWAQAEGEGSVPAAVKSRPNFRLASEIFPPNRLDIQVRTSTLPGMHTREKDDNPLDNAGPVGQRFAGILAEKVTSAVDGFPDSSRRQRAAIARMVARYVDEHADEVER